MMVAVANSRLPSVTAQDVGRELYHKRQDLVRIIGDIQTLRRIAWIFQRTPDIFDIEFDQSSLIVRRV